MNKVLTGAIVLAILSMPAMAAANYGFTNLSAKFGQDSFITSIMILGKYWA